MENNDVVVTEEVTTEEVVTPIAETTEPVVEEIVTPVEDNKWEEEITLDDLLSALITTDEKKEETEIKKEEIPDWPVFDDTKDDSITEKELEELETEVWLVVEELEAEVETANKKTEEVMSQLADEIKNNEEISTALKKIVEHPSLGKYATDILEWKEVDIPKLLEDKMNEDIASMADISTQAPISVEPKKISLWQRLWSMRTL